MWRKKKMRCRQENCQDQQKKSRIKFFSFCFFFSQTQISLRASVGAFVQIPVMSFNQPGIHINKMQKYGPIITLYKDFAEDTLRFKAIFLSLF